MSKPVPVARIALGPHPGQHVDVFGYPVGGEMNIATVGLGGDIGGLIYTTPDTAEKLANGILLAVCVARGEKLPTTLDQFLASKTGAE